MTLSSEAGSAPPAGEKPSHVKFVTFLVSGTFFMEQLDGTVITPAMPAMAASFHVSPIDLNTGVSAYLLALGVFIPISGWLADRLGTRVVFTLAIAIFSVASIFCGLAHGLGEFIAMRVLQAIGGAMMVPVGRLVVLQITPKDRRMNALATLIWPALIAPVLGPPIGGFITTYASWRWIFYLNVPLGIAALIAALAILPDRRAQDHRPFDWPGFVLSGLGILSLMYGIELLSHENAPWQEAVMLMTLGTALLAAAVLHMNRSAAPMIDLSPMRTPTFAIAIMGGSFSRAAIGSAPFLLPLMFQIGFGFDAFRSGLLMISIFAGNILMKTMTTPVLRRFGFKPVLITNNLLNALALLACAFLTRDTPIAAIVAVLFFGGLVRSLQFTIMTSIAFADIPLAKMSPANALFSTMSQLSMGMGIALGAIGVRLGHMLSAMTGFGVSPVSDYHFAFVLVAIVALTALIEAIKLERGSGDHLAKPS
jgi:EmrB/QacA subfamily drug resistance transporter